VKSLIVSISVLCIVMSGCQQQTADKETAFDMQKAKSFIDSVNTKFSQQLRDGDSVALASNYWPDAELLLSNSEPIKGKDIMSAWGATIRMGINAMTFTTTDIAGDANFLIETGSYEMKDGNKTLIDRGKYVVVWKQQNGEWKLYRDMGNTSLPAVQ
jgi:ketosteroid isomerase-like protein